MKKYVLVIFIVATLPLSAKAFGEVKTLTGIVQNSYGVQVKFKTTTGAVYLADVSNASVLRKYGSALKFEEILVGDKIQVTGKVWEDNSISAQSLKNLSLYSHNSTFTAKVFTLDPYNQSFTMQSKQYGIQTIHTNALTIFKYNNSPSSLNGLEPGMNVKVKGVWERNSSEVAASSVEATVRMIGIEFTGSVKGKVGTALTVIGNGNVIYGVEASQAKITSKNNKTLKLDEINLDDQIKVTGKHRSEDTKVIASKIKDLSK